MRALYAGGENRPHWQEVSEPTLQSPVSALVRPLAVALCDLDVPYITGLLPTEQPYAVGHEFTGEVVAVGDAVSNLAVRDRVSVPFQISCGACTRCRAGRSLDCQSVPPLASFGLEPWGGGAQWGGAIADLVRIPYADAMCVRLPEGLDPVAVASLSDNVPDGFRCVAPYLRPGDAVLVLGSASIGLYAVATARALAAPVTYVDNHPARLAVAERLGASTREGVPTGQPFGEFPLTVAAISTPDGLLSALRSVEPGGTCVSAGIQFFPVTVPFLELYRRGIHFITGRASARDEIPQVLKLIEQSRFPVADITALVVDVDEIVQTLSAELPYKTVVRFPTL